MRQAQFEKNDCGAIVLHCHGQGLNIHFHAVNCFVVVEMGEEKRRDISLSSSENMTMTPKVSVLMKEFRLNGQNVVRFN